MPICRATRVGCGCCGNLFGTRRWDFGAGSRGGKEGERSVAVLQSQRMEDGGRKSLGAMRDRKCQA